MNIEKVSMNSQAPKAFVKWTNNNERTKRYAHFPVPYHCRFVFLSLLVSLRLNLFDLLTLVRNQFQENPLRFWLMSILDGHFTVSQPPSSSANHSHPLLDSQPRNKPRKGLITAPFKHANATFYLIHVSFRQQNANDESDASRSYRFRNICPPYFHWPIVWCHGSAEFWSGVRKSLSAGGSGRRRIRVSF